MELLILRDIFSEDSTAGNWYVVDESNGDENWVCYTLEDPRRFPGIKVFGATCIAAGRYQVKTSVSRRFGRRLPMVYNCANGYELKAEGISFKGIRMHGLNRASQTHGCIGVAYKRTDDNTGIYQTAETEVTKLIYEAELRGQEVWLEVVDQIGDARVQ